MLTRSPKARDSEREFMKISIFSVWLGLRLFRMNLKIRSERRMKTCVAKCFVKKLDWQLKVEVKLKPGVGGQLKWGERGMTSNNAENGDWWVRWETDSLPEKGKLEKEVNKYKKDNENTINQSIVVQQVQDPSNKCATRPSGRWASKQHHDRPFIRCGALNINSGLFYTETRSSTAIRCDSDCLNAFESQRMLKQPTSKLYRNNF